MILEFDVGNTRAKWRLLEGQQVQTRGQFLLNDQQAFSEVVTAVNEISSVGPGFIRASSVAGEALNQQLADSCVAAFGSHVEPVFAKVATELAGVRCAYTDINKLGVDRWLALAAASQRCAGGCMVVDAGSALTIDMVDATGQHVGGYIVPGLRMQNTVLWQDTDAVQVKHSENVLDLAPGDSTEACVNRGIQLMQLAFIERCWADLLRQQVSDPQLFLTGGDAPLWRQHLALPALQVDDLVFEGLSLALPAPVSS